MARDSYTGVEYEPICIKEIISKLTEADKLSHKQRAEMSRLMDKYNFDGADLLAHRMGTTKKYMKTYIGKMNKGRLPECTNGGTLNCEKRDYELRKGLTPAVLCKDCVNKKICSLAKEDIWGYLFFFIKDENAPRRLLLVREPIRDENILKKLKITKNNPWKDGRWDV